MKKALKYLGFAAILIMTSCGGTSSSETTTVTSTSEPTTVETTSDEPTTVPVDERTIITEEDKIYPKGEKNPNFDYDPMLEGKFDENKYYRNDLLKLGLPDPHVLYCEEDGLYYIYGTTDRTGSKTLDCYSTSNFNEFKHYPNIDQNNPDSWSNCAERSRFAPEVYCFDGTYYLYYSDVSKYDGMRYISVMTSDKPYGPFVEYDGGKDAVFKHNKSLGLAALDQTIFVDDDGKMYMYYSIYDTGNMQYLIGVELESPVSAKWDTYKILVRPGELSPNTKSTNLLSWECLQGFKVAEGPYMLKSPVNGKYYLTYSVNHYPDRYYTVCYAVCDTPLGDYTKPYTKGKAWSNYLFGFAGSKASSNYDKWDGFMSGCGHHCFFKVGDQVMIGYHAHKNRRDSASGRMFAMDYIFFDKDGAPYAQGPSYSIQPLPEAISDMKNLTSKAIFASEGIENAEKLVDNFVCEHTTLTDKDVDEAKLPAGKSYVKFTFEKEITVSAIFIYNSIFYDKATYEDINYINLGNGNYLTGGPLNDGEINDDKEFVFPDSGYTFDIADVKTNKIIIGFQYTSEIQLNEIMILGKE